MLAEIQERHTSGIALTIYQAWKDINWLLKELERVDTEYRWAGGRAMGKLDKANDALEKAQEQVRELEVKEWLRLHGPEIDKLYRD